MSFLDIRILLRKIGVMKIRGDWDQLISDEILLQIAKNIMLIMNMNNVLHFQFFELKMCFPADVITVLAEHKEKRCP